MTQFSRERRVCYTGSHQENPEVGRRQKEERARGTGGKAFIVAFSGMNQQDRISRFRMIKFE